MGKPDTTTKLAATAIAGQSVIYALSVVLARRLGVEGFEAYAVASAVFSFMVMFAPRGIEKYSLRVLPALFEHRDWSQAGSFLRFGLRHILCRSLLLATVVGLWVIFVSDSPRTTKLAIGVSCLSLPAGALVHYGVEVLSAHGRVIMATAVYRVVVPSMTFLFVMLLIYSEVELGGAMAVACWGAAWAFALIVMTVILQRVLPHEIWRARAAGRASTWLAEARPFWFYRISLALAVQAAVIALDALQSSAVAVGAYAAAVATVQLPLVLVTSTNRYYSRQLSVLLEERDFAGMLKLRRQRRRRLVPAIALFLATVFVFGRDILGTFRAEFVEEGYTALRLLAAATATSMLFSLAPTYLKYAGHGRTTLVTVAGAAVVQVILLVALVPHYGAAGAALAYCLSVCGMYLVFARMAHQELLRLGIKQQSSPDPGNHA